MMTEPISREHARRMIREHDARGICTRLHLHAPCAACGREDYEIGILGYDGLCEQCAREEVQG